MRKLNGRRAPPIAAGSVVAVAEHVAQAGHLAAQAADAYPLLVVVPNVVKMNWAREAALWTPAHRATVVHGDGHSIDGFADIIVVNYEVLDRHVGWLGELGLRGMVVDEAHYIKNRKSQRSQHVLRLSERIRTRTGHPLLMALTGTPLINDIEDFTAIWQFLGWIDETRPVGELMEALEETGLTPADRGFSISCPGLTSRWRCNTPGIAWTSSAPSIRLRGPGGKMKKLRMALECMSTPWGGSRSSPSA